MTSSMKEQSPTCNLKSPPENAHEFHFKKSTTSSGCSTYRSQIHAQPPCAQHRLTRHCSLLRPPGPLQQSFEVTSPAYERSTSGHCWSTALHCSWELPPPLPVLPMAGWWNETAHLHHVRQRSFDRTLRNTWEMASHLRQEKPTNIEIQCRQRPLFQSSTMHILRESKLNYNCSFMANSRRQHSLRGGGWDGAPVNLIFGFHSTCIFWRPKLYYYWFRGQSEHWKGVYTRSVSMTKVGEKKAGLWAPRNLYSARACAVTS